jgi:hypothetical protein
MVAAKKPLLLTGFTPSRITDVGAYARNAAIVQASARKQRVSSTNS